MTLGSFTIDGQRIEVETDYSPIDGVVHKFIVVAGESREQIAVTTYRGIEVVDDRFPKGDLQRGLNVIRRRAVRS